MNNVQLKRVCCEVCGEKTIHKSQAIMQTCHECKDLFEIEMSKIEFEEIYNGVSINIVKERGGHVEQRRNGKRKT